MEINVYLALGIVLVAVLTVWLICHIVMTRRIYGMKDLVSVRERELAACRAVTESLKERLEVQKNDYEVRLESIKEESEKSLKAFKERSDEELQKQLAVVREQLVNSTNELLRQREAGLRETNKTGMDLMTATNKANMEALMAPLKASIANMEKAMDASRKSMEENKESHDKNTASLAVELRKAIEDIRNQSGSIGAKAEELALALRSKSKIQGIWGETLLDSILEKEGLKEGRDYDREETLRDRAGSTVFNEDSGKRMRPDFIFHYPDGKDVVIDAKVSLKDYVDFVNTTDEAMKAACLSAHVASVRTHVRELSAKNYSSYVKPPRTSMDYVLMFIPNDSAWRAALGEDPMLWQQAYEKGVLITTEQSIMPFLRIIKMAWTRIEQTRNQEEMVEAARRMLDRVGDFYAKYREIGKRIEQLSAVYGEAENKLKDKGQSIASAARQVVRLGGKVSAGKELPEVSDQT